MDSRKTKVTRRRDKLRNVVLEDNGDWLLVDISTPKHPSATMAVDKIIFETHVLSGGGRVRAESRDKVKYIYARFKKDLMNIYFHKSVLNSTDCLEVDHIKHGTMEFIDNRISNLRLVTSSQNNMNKPTQLNNTSGFKGVCMNNRLKKWMAYIKINGKQRYLGYFRDIDDAIKARKKAEDELFGEYSFNS